MNYEASTCATTDRREAFIELLTQHKHQLFNLIYCILQNSSDAEDVFQQTSLALWESFDRFQPGTNFGAWASQVARYRISHFLRSKRRDQLYFSDELIEQLAECPFESYEMQELRLAALSACRQKLSQADQRLIAICYGTSGTIREAASQIGRPAQAVYGSLSRIRNMLHDCIERRLAREGHR